MLALRQSLVHDINAELWVSLASLLRAYAAVHGHKEGPSPVIEACGERISVRCGDKWLKLRRDGASINWERENGAGGTLELTEQGRLRSVDGEEEMDMIALKLAQELTR